MPGSNGCRRGDPPTPVVSAPGGRDAYHDDGSCTTTTGGSPHDLPRLVERGTMARRGVLALFSEASAPPDWSACAADDSGSVDVSSPGTARGGGPGGAPRRGRRVLGGGRRRRDPRGDRRSLPGRRLQRRQRAHRDRHRPRRTSTSSFGTASGVAEGVPLTIRLKVYDLNGEKATPLAGAAVYLWHCNRQGEYSLYSEAVASENYLRGVQEAGHDGSLEFTSIFPAAYDGRWPTSTSRSSRASTTRPSATNSCRPPPTGSRSPRTSAPTSTRPRATRPASATSPPPRSPATWSSLTVTRCSGDGHGQRGRGVRGLAQRPRLRRWEDGRVRPPFPPATPPRQTAHCPRRRFATSWTGLRVVHPCPVLHGPVRLLRLQHLHRRGAGRGRRPGRRTPRPRSTRSGWPGTSSATSTCRCRRCSSAEAHPPCCRPAI